MKYKIGTPSNRHRHQGFKYCLDDPADEFGGAYLWLKRGDRPRVCILSKDKESWVAVDRQSSVHGPLPLDQLLVRMMMLGYVEVED